MASLTAPQVYGLAFDAGFRGDACDLATAIAGWSGSPEPGESHGDPGAINAKAQDAKWGPAIGVWQIRSLIADRGTGRKRDPNRLADPKFNASSAFAIYTEAGASFTPWKVYTDGLYRQNLRELQAMDIQTKLGGKSISATEAAGNIAGSVITDPVGTVTGAGGAILSNITDPIEAVAAALAAIGRVVSKLFDAETWKRLGLVLGGALLMVVAIIIVGKDTIAGKALGATPLGAAVKAAT